MADIIKLPTEQFISMLNDKEKLSLLQSIIDDFGGIEIVFKENHGSTYIENNAFIMEGRNVKVGDIALEIQVD